MVDGWKTQKLGEFGSLKNGANFSREDFGEGNPIVNVKNLFRGRFVTIDDLPSIVPGTIKNLKDNRLQKNDLLFARSSLVASGTGQVAIVNELPHENTLFSGFIIRYRIDKIEELDPRFLNYYLRGPKARRYFESIGTGTTITNLTQPTLFNLEVDTPPLHEQQSIASILSALDDKIELNLQMNKTLEDMAMTLYKHWFVDFGPFKDGAFVSSELGEIPKGWEVKRMDDVLEIKYGKDHKKLEPGDIPVYGSGGIMRYANQFLYDQESILIPRKGTLSNLFYLSTPFWSVDTMFYSKIKRKHFGKYVFHFLKTLDLAGMDVGSAVPSLTTELLNKIAILVPPNIEVEKYDEIVSGYFRLVDANLMENNTLTTLRDTLLPKLISGEVRVKDAARSLAEVL